jgi:poly-gamma-glutamate synthesis protein (capsule biosynthesis protein)
MRRRSFWSVLIVLIPCVILAYANFDDFVKKFEEEKVFGINTSLESPLDKTEQIINKPNSINFVGDILLGRDVESYLKRNGSDFPYRKISFNNQDSYTVANFESAIPEKHIQTPNNTFRFSTEAKHLSSLAMAGFTHMSLANNHSFDFGLPGYNHTISTLWDNNLVPFGHPTSLSTSSVTLLKMKDKNVAIIAMHTLFTAPKSEDIKSVLEYANSISDYQVVYIHWGDEYQHKQSASQRKLVEEFSNYGTDLVIGHHPHVVQGIERVNDTLVFYSLGNYIFDQYFSESVQNGLMLTFNLNEEPSINLIPVTSIDSRAQPQFMDDDNKLLFLQKIAENSDLDLKENIEMGVIPLSVKLASSSEVFIMAE